MEPLVLAAAIGEATVGVLLGVFIGRGDRWRFVLALCILLLLSLALAGISFVVRDRLTLDASLWLRGGVAVSWLGCAIAYRFTLWWRGRTVREPRTPFDFS